MMARKKAARPAKQTASRRKPRLARKPASPAKRKPSATAPVKPARKRSDRVTALRALVTDHPKAKPEYWIREIEQAWQQGVAAIVRTGQLLIAAKAELKHGEWTAMIGQSLPFGERMVQMLMAIGSDPRLADPRYQAKLPPHWRTLYELTRVSDDEFKAGIETGLIRPELERSQISKGSLAKLQAVHAAAEQDPQRFGKLKDAVAKNGSVEAPYRRLTVMQRADGIRAAPPPLPGSASGQTYRGGIIDYPWPAEPEEDDPERLARGYYPYPTLAIADGCKLDVGSILHPDGAVVGLWVTNFHLAQGHHLPLLQAWGLTPVTIRTWVKDRMGQGQVLRGQTEHLVIARRGKPVIDATSLTTFFHAAVEQKHSRKPQKAYDDFARMVPSERYFSLFEKVDRGARWDGHGDQVPAPDALAAADDAASRPLPQAGDASTAGDDAIETFGNISEGLLRVLSAIDAGKPIAFNDNDHVIRGLYTGKRKRTLTKAGRQKLAELRAEEAEREAVAALPDDLDALVEDYRQTLKRRHDAVTEGETAAAESEAVRLYRLQMKANGGTHFGMDCDDSRAERLRRDTAAAIGDEPLWGQRGLFRLTIDGTPYLVEHNEDCDFAVYAEDPTRPFISETGYRSMLGADGPAFGHTVADQAEAFIREEIDTPLNRSGSKRQPRKLHQRKPLSAAERKALLTPSPDAADDAEAGKAEAAEPCAAAASEPGAADADPPIPRYLERDESNALKYPDARP